MVDIIGKAIKKGRQKREAYKGLQKQRRKSNTQKTEHHTKNYFDGKHGALFKPEQLNLQLLDRDEYTPNNNIMPKLH